MQKVFTNAVAIRITADNFQSSKKATFTAYPVVLSESGQIEIFESAPTGTQAIRLNPVMKYIEADQVKSYAPETIDITFAFARVGKGQYAAPDVAPQLTELLNLAQFKGTTIQKENRLLKAFEGPLLNIPDATLLEGLTLPAVATATMYR